MLTGLGGEALVEHPARGGGQQVAHPLPFGGLLGLHLGQAVPAVLLGRALAQLHQFRTALLGTPPAEQVVDRAFAHRELVDGELRVACDVPGGHGGLAGLEVDHVGAPLGVRFDAVHGAANAHHVGVGFEGDVEIVLRGDGRAAAALHDVPA